MRCKGEGREKRRVTEYLFNDLLIIIDDLHTYIYMLNVLCIGGLFESPITAIKPS